MDINQINRAYCEQYYIEQYEKESKMKPHKHSELIKAWADGAEIQYQKYGYEWVDCLYNRPHWNDDIEYRIKPEPKADVENLLYVENCFATHNIYNERANLKLTFDSETGELKSAEVLK